jgi:hypothetical protein
MAEEKGISMESSVNVIVSYNYRTYPKWTSVASDFLMAGQQSPYQCETTSHHEKCADRITTLRYR